MSLSRDFIEFIECLNKRRVEYLLVGGHAVAFHGWPRFTKDIDFWINPTRENAERLLLALDDFGFSDIGLSPEDFSEKGKVVQLGLPPNRIDLITTAEGIDFSSSWSRRIETDYAGSILLVIHKDDLLQNKKTMSRKQDIIDIEKLEQE